MSSRVQPVNLKERIAALEQFNNASQNNQRPSPPPTSTGSSFLTPQTTGGALKEKIAKFERKGGVPVPRGSFGLGAPPLVENGQAKRRGELYGNRIPSALRSHTTGPQLTGGISTHLTGPSPPIWSEARHSVAHDGKIPGLEYNDHSEDTGGFEPPDSSLGQPQEFSYASRRSSPPPVPPLSDPPPAARLPAERRVASDSVRRGIAFSSALEAARKAESDKQAVYDPRSLSPNHTGSNHQYSPLLGVDDSQNTRKMAPSIVISNGEADSISEDDKETIKCEDRDLSQPQTRQDEKEEFTTPLPTSDVETGSKHSSPKAESLETSPPHSIQSQSVVTAPEETDAGDSTYATSDAHIEPENGPAPGPKIIDDAPAKPVVEHVNAVARTPNSPSTPPLPASPAELKIETSAQIENLPQQVVPSETHVTVLAPHGKAEVGQSSVAPIISTNVSGDESDSSAGSTATIQDTRRMMKEEDDDDDSDLFVKPIKRKSPMNNSFEERSPLVDNGGNKNGNGAPSVPPKDTLLDPNRLVPSTPSKSGLDSTTSSEDSQASPEPSTRDSYVSQTVTMDSRPASLMDSSSPGHVSFAQRISPAISRGVPIFIPASSERQTAKSSTITVEPLRIRKHCDVPEDVDTSEFGVVTVGGSSSTSHLRGYTEPDYQTINNRASTFSAVVRGRVRETQTLPASSKKLPSTPPKKKQQALVVEPMSPGLNELSMLMHQSVLLESKLMKGDYPDESEGKREIVDREAHEKGREKAKEQTDEGTKLKRTNTVNSSKSGKSHDSEGKKRKLNLKRTFGMGRNARQEAVVPMESIPATPPPPGVSLKDLSRSKSMDTLRSSKSAAVPPLPSFSLEPPPLPKPGKARSIHALPTGSRTEGSASASSASTSSASGPGMDSGDIPPPPPPKSPPGKYLSSIRRFASSSRSHAGAYPRYSVSNSSELSSDDSVTVITPPDYSPDFADSRTLLETRTRTRSGSRSGKAIIIGAGTPPPTGIADEDRASVFTSGSGSVKWPSSSPKKGGGMSRAASFAEKMFSRSRTKSSTSSTSSYDPDRYAASEQPMSRIHPPSSMPTLPHVVPPSPSLHELILSEPLSLSIPELNEPQPLDSKLTPTVTRPPSWLSTSSGDTGTSSAYSRLLDKDFFDSFPPVPETLPPNHSRANSQQTIRTKHSSRPY